MHDIDDGALAVARRSHASAVYDAGAQPHPKALEPGLVIVRIADQVAQQPHGLERLLGLVPRRHGRRGHPVEEAAALAPHSPYGSSSSIRPSVSRIPDAG